MIEHLEEQLEVDRYGNIFGSYPPTSWQLMQKINELIDEVNKLKTKLEEEQK